VAKLIFIKVGFIFIKIIFCFRHELLQNFGFLLLMWGYFLAKCFYFDWVLCNYFLPEQVGFWKVGVVNGGITTNKVGFVYLLEFIFAVGYF
jgi:hypothetical protein